MRNADREMLIHEIEEFLKEDKVVKEEELEEDYMIIIRKIGETILGSTRKETETLRDLQHQNFALSVQNKCFNFIEENFEAGDNIEEDPALLLAVEIGEMTVEFFENA